MDSLFYIGALLVGLSTLFLLGGLLVALVQAIPKTSGIGPRPYWRRVIDRFNQL